MADQEETKPAAPVGGWTCSRSEEQWHEWLDCATREEAIGEAPNVLDLEDGYRFYTGRAVRLTTQHLSDRAESIADSINENLYELTGNGDCLEVEIAPSREQLAELDVLIDGWIEKHKLLPEYFLIEHLKSHVFEAPEPEPVPARLRYERCEGCGKTIGVGELVKHYADDVVAHAKCPERSGG